MTRAPKRLSRMNPGTKAPFQVNRDAKAPSSIEPRRQGAISSRSGHEGVLAMEFHGSAEDLARICHAHPTLSEAIHDAAMAVDKRAIHKVN